MKKQPPSSFRPPLFSRDPSDSYSATGGSFYADFPDATYITFASKLMLTSKERQAMLADRLYLVIHFETHETPVYALVLAKPGQLGPKLRRHDEQRSCDAPATDIFPPRCRNLAMTVRTDGTRLSGARDVTLDYLAHGLPTMDRLGRPVVDRTGLAGPFDFTVEWMPVAPCVLPPTTDAPGQPDAPGFVEALRE